ncbi:MAG: short-chain dehydrogenase [Crocinitomicaceae bacterium]|nr:short-chain dehydrogenase [Crocinitomicaceae bacterium]|tara:strand:- start:1705 stop:2622 length:918 start_codon:yes stop_codon:yes gene_type:complete
MNKTVLITGANAGLGKETARQLALKKETEKIYLACRNPQKAEAAKQELEAETSRSIFEIVILDVSDLDSVEQTVAQLPEAVDAIVMNAGGIGGLTPNAVTKYGVNDTTAINVLGHVHLVDKLIENNKLNKVALYVGSEAVRGVALMGMKPVKLNNSSADEFASIATGSFFKANVDPMVSYGYVKYLAIMNFFAMARKHPEIKFLSMSPGGTSGTNAADNLKGPMKFMFKTMSNTLMPIMGLMHNLDVGAKRLVDAISDNKYESGKFYASKKKTTGEVADQISWFPDLNNTMYQDNAYEAIHRFIN